MKSSTSNKISTCLWFEDQAEEAANFYASLLDEAKILETVPYLVDTPSNKPVGSVMTVDFMIKGFRFMALNGGPIFTPNPSVSFFMNFDPSTDKDALENLERVWNELSSGGKVLMELGEYPFSSKYGWVQDKFGISWQLILSDSDGEDRPFIVPSLLFAGQNTNNAEKAINFYKEVFHDSKIGNIARYPEDTEAADKGSVMYGDFVIENTWIAAMDSGIEHEFNFNEGISLVVSCETQEEIDYYFEKLSADPSAEVCGWLKDKFGVSWQIVPTLLSEIWSEGDREKSKNVMAAIMEMKKLDIKQLKQAYEQKAV